MDSLAEPKSYSWLISKSRVFVRKIDVREFLLFATSAEIIDLAARLMLQMTPRMKLVARQSSESSPITSWMGAAFSDRRKFRRCRQILCVGAPRLPSSYGVRLPT